MRGIIKILFVLILILIFILISYNIFSITKTSYEEGTSFIEELFRPQRPYVFDINNLIFDMSRSEKINEELDTFFLHEGNFCKELKKCIEYSAKNNGKPCEVANIKGAREDLGRITASYGYSGCDSEVLKEKIYGIERKICYFNSDVFNLYDYYAESEEKSIWQSGSKTINPFYSYEPFIHDCTFQMLIEDFSSPIEDPNYIREKYYLPPFYDYPPNKPFPYDSTGAQVKIFISNATPGSDSERTCNFNLFVCIQPAIASSKNEKTIDMFNIFSSLSIENFRCCNKSEYGSDIKLNKYYPVTYTFEFSEFETKPNMYQILSTLDRAFWEWSKKNFEKSDLIEGILKDKPSNWNPNRIRFSYKPWDIAKFVAESSGYKIAKEEYIGTNCGIDPLTYETFHCPNDYVCTEETTKWDPHWFICCPSNYPNYINGKCYSQSLISYPNCFDEEVLKSSEYDPKEGPLLIYGPNWKDKFSDTNYSKLSMTVIYYYNVKEDANGFQNLVITPRITLCRDR